MKAQCHSVGDYFSNWEFWFCNTRGTAGSLWVKRNDTETEILKTMAEVVRRKDYRLRKLRIRFI